MALGYERSLFTDELFIRYLKNPLSWRRNILNSKVFYEACLKAIIQIIIIYFACLKLILLKYENNVDIKLWI